MFHRVQREGQLGISYILVVFGNAHVFGGACMCMWCMYTHVCFSGTCVRPIYMCMYVYLIHLLYMLCMLCFMYVSACFSGACGVCMCMWLVYDCVCF